MVILFGLLLETNKTIAATLWEREDGAVGNQIRKLYINISIAAPPAVAGQAYNPINDNICTKVRTFFTHSIGEPNGVIKTIFLEGFKKKNSSFSSPPGGNGSVKYTAVNIMLMSTDPDFSDFEDGTLSWNIRFNLILSTDFIQDKFLHINQKLRERLYHRLSTTDQIDDLVRNQIIGQLL